MSKNAEHQQAFRDRLKNEGAARVEFTLDRDLLQLVEQTKTLFGFNTRQDAMTYLFNQGVEAMQSQIRKDQIRRDDPRLDPKETPSSMTDSERMKREQCIRTDAEEEIARATSRLDAEAKAASRLSNKELIARNRQSVQRRQDHSQAFFDFLYQGGK